MSLSEKDFSEFMEQSLYGDQGFYTLGGGAGRSRDYLTSPEIGDLFGFVLASYIDDWYEGLGTSERAIVVDAGCGPGSLAASIARAKMKNAGMIEYLLVDRSPVHLETCKEKLDSVETGFSWSCFEKIPECNLPTLVIANELFDNLIFDIGYADKTYSRFKPDELEGTLLGLDTYANFGVFKNIDNAKGADVPISLGHFRVPLHVGIGTWFEELSQATNKVGSLTLLVIDYMKRVQEFEDGNWLRFYSNNQRIVGVDEVLTALRNGSIGDITTDVIREDIHVLLDIEGFSKIHFDTQGQWLNRQGIRDWCVGSTPSESSYEKLKNWVDSESDDNLPQDFSRELNLLTDERGLGSFTIVQAKREI